jgi:hypothetical protein
MSPQSRVVAGIVLIIVPTVEIGGASILSLLISDPTYAQNDLRQDLWRVGHAHAGVWLVLSLVVLRYVDEATLSEGMKWLVRLAFPAAALLMPLAFFLSVLSPEAREPNAMIYLALRLFWPPSTARPIRLFLFLSITISSLLEPSLPKSLCTRFRAAGTRG